MPQEKFCFFNEKSNLCNQRPKSDKKQEHDIHCNVNDKGNCCKKEKGKDHCKQRKSPVKQSKKTKPPVEPPVDDKSNKPNTIYNLLDNIKKSCPKESDHIDSLKFNVDDKPIKKNEKSDKKPDKPSVEPPVDDKSSIKSDKKPDEPPDEPPVEPPVDKIKDKRGLDGLSIEELYDTYNEYTSSLELSDDPEEKDRYKISIQNIRGILDDKVLTDKQLEKLHGRGYLAYPDHNNPEFNDDISRKLEFNANKLNFNQQTTCGKQTFELGNHQRLLYNFMNKNTPYKSLLIFHGVGVGKTCTAVKISESFRDIHAKENNRIIVLRKGGLGQGWKNTIFDPKMGENQCSGHEFLDLINETKGFEKRDDKSIKRDVNKLIKRFYDFYAYREFSNSIDNMLKKCSNEEEERFMIKNNFSNRLLIVDEYHNLRDDGSSEEGEKDEQKKALKNLLKIVENADNLRLVLLTATPMFNLSEEIFNLLNILLLNDKRPIIDYKQYIKDNSITEVGIDILNKKFKGYVSYLRGENPVNFPIRIYPSDYGDKQALKPPECPKKDIFGKDIPTDDKMRFLITYKNELKGDQKTTYKELISLLDDEKKLGIQDSNLKQICNVYYPSKKNKYGEEGFKSVFNESKNKFTYKKDIPHILDYNNLHNYSIKIKNIIDNIKDSEGIIFIYSEYIWGGAVPMGLALEHIGFNKYGNKNLLNLSERGDKKGTYIILSKNDKVSNNNDEEIKVVSSPENKDGDLIKVIIGSSITGEGMDFKNIRQIHVMDPWWHLSKLEQIIGRGIRYCSHIKLPEDKRNVTVFLHTATNGDKETVDHYSYRLGEKKSVEVGRIETILKKNAFDCNLFKETNIISNKKLKMDVKVSKNGIGKFKKSISDKPYSKICSYQKKCKYNCNDINITKTVKDLHLNDDTTDFNYFKDLKRNILLYLTELYQKNKYYKLNEIVDHIHYKKDIKNKIIYYLLKNIINFKDTIYDEYNNPGYLICKNNIYVFQPLYNNDINVPIFYRSSTNMNNKINTDTISEDIKGKLDSLITKKQIVMPDIIDIIDNIKEKYKDLLDTKVYKRFELIKDEYKQPLFNSCIDELSVEEKQVLINYILTNDHNKVKLVSGELTDEELLYLSYEYLKNQTIQIVDGNHTLFNYNKKPFGYMLMNAKNQLTFYDLDHNIVDKSLIKGELLESIKKLSKTEYDKIFKLNKIYIYPFTNYTKKLSEENEFRYTFKFIDDTKLSKGVIVGNDPGYIKSLLNRFLKLDISEFGYLKEKDNIEELYDKDTLYLENKYKIIQLVFRIKNMSGNYIISNELHDLGLK